jgi:hypothetical protein
MTTPNPHTSDPAQRDTWQLGYLAGWQEPEQDHFLPVAPILLDVYKAGELAGRDDRRTLPSASSAPAAPSGPGPGDHGEGQGGEIAGEVAEHVIVHAIGAGAEFLFKAAGGLVALVLTVVTIPGDVRIKPLEPEFEGPADQSGDTYVAVCPRNDHPMVIDGTTRDGFWTGKAQSGFVDADAERKAHGHPECFVARCSTADNTCGPVSAM